VKKRSGRVKKMGQLSRWGLPKRAVILWDPPWPTSAKTKRLFLARQKLGAELEDLEVALEARHQAIADDELFVQRQGKLREWYQRELSRLEEKFREADRVWSESYAEDEKAAKSASVVSIVHTRRVSRGLPPPKRKRT